MFFTRVSCLGFPIKEAAQIFACIMCGVSVVLFGFTIFQIIIYIINGVFPWLQLIPTAWSIVQFACYFFVLSACKQKLPARMIPALGFSAFGIIGMLACVGWSLVLIIQDGYVSLYWFDWEIGWPAPALAGLAALWFLYITVTMVIAFKFVKFQRIEIERQAQLPHYARGDWKANASTTFNT
ncbi:hypothetical protein PRIPAC_86145 [Pristionchus pacificus]|uniref:Uncharacterized protein n=1 Tax=Pristionchus pacificus TaxID=54126 RepID=A0A454XZG8_PRIPA|nr:hypothetical protein PRIPAC_86145 [Pristionchus pacificus]|eukprot:PDM69724.1 hypothetical protein PRIPAC_44820 [Pristionchus pacificus]